MATERFGPGTSPDSAVYVSAADALVEGDGLLSHTGLPLVEFPPAYPVLLATVRGLLAIDALSAARWTNALLAAAIVVLGMQLARRCIGRNWIVLTVGLVLAGSPVLLNAAMFVWSEALFIMLTLATVELLCRAVRTPERWGLLVAAALVAGLAVLTRYIGVTLVGVGAVVLLLAPSTLPLTRRLRRAALWSAVGLAGLGGWLLRNLAVASTPTGHRSPADLTIATNLGDSVKHISAWVVPGSIAPLTRVLLLAVGCGLGVFLWHAGRRSTSRDSDPERLPAVVLGAFAVAYVTTLVVMRTLVAFDPIDDRLLSPVFPSLVLIVGVGGDRLLHAWQGRWHVLEPVAAAVVALWLVHPFGTVARWLPAVMNEGPGGYATAAWQNSDLAAHAATVELEPPVVSNDDAALYLLAGVRSGPAPVEAGGGPRSDVVAFAGRVEAAGSARLVWFDGRGAAGTVAPAAIDEVLELRVLVEASDGRIYELSPSDTGPGH